MHRRREMLSSSRTSLFNILLIAYYQGFVVKYCESSISIKFKVIGSLNDIIKQKQKHHHSMGTKSDYFKFVRN